MVAKSNSGSRTVAETFPECFISRWYQTVANNPDAVAVIDGTLILTRRELYTWAGMFCATYRKAGLGVGSCVALDLPRSAEFLAATLGAWMHRCSVVPLDRSSPLDRRQSMIRDAQPAFTVAASVCRPAPPLTDSKRNRSELPVELPVRDFSREDTAYIIFTSGTSGFPKGVEVSHRGILPCLDAQIDAFGLTDRSRAGWILNPAFDASISDWGTAILSGAELVIGQQLQGGAIDAIRFAAEYQLTHLDISPSVLAQTQPSELPPSLVVLICGGEPSPPELLARWARSVRIINVYGPTETTICSSLCEVTPEWRAPLLGTPIPGSLFSVRDEFQKRLVSSDDLPTVEMSSVTGELWIGGVGVARGYLKRQDLTEDRFVFDDGVRWYRTGDRVSLHRDGALEYRGRMDRQIKRAGVRIELQEIEMEVVRYPGVSAVAAVFDPTIGSIGCLVEGDLDVGSLRDWAKNRLPSAAVPSLWGTTPRLPRNVNGKVDYCKVLAHLAEQIGIACSPTVALKSSEECDSSRVLAVCRTLVGDESLLLSDTLLDHADSLTILSIAKTLEHEGIHLSYRSLLQSQSLLAACRACSSREPLQVNTVQVAAELAEKPPDVRLTAGLPKVPHMVRDAFRETRKRPHVLVTGATGTIGRGVMRELLRRGMNHAVGPVSHDREFDLTLLVRHDAPVAPTCFDNSHDPFTTLHGDIRLRRFGLSTATWEGLTRSIDTVVHLAATTQPWLAEEDYFSTNVVGTERVLDLATEGAFKRLIHASSLSVFSPSGRAATFRPRACPAQLMRHDTEAVQGGYPRSKAEAENAIVERMDASAFGLTILRYALVADWEAPSSYLSRLIGAIRKVGCIPEIGSKLFLNTISMECAVDAAVKAVERSLKVGAAVGNVRHLCSSRCESLTLLVNNPVWRGTTELKKLQVVPTVERHTFQQELRRCTGLTRIERETLQRELRLSEWKEEGVTHSDLFEATDLHIHGAQPSVGLDGVQCMHCKSVSRIGAEQSVLPL